MNNDTQTAVPAGLATYLGLATTILGALAAIIAGAEGNDTATITAGIATILATITTMGGRYAQAVVAIKAASLDVTPMLDAVQAAMTPNDGSKGTDFNTVYDEPGNDATLAEQGILPDDLSSHEAETGEQSP